MHPQYAIHTIEPPTFWRLLRQYPDVLEKYLADLDKQRLTAIPQTVKQRGSGYNSPFVTKDELLTLVDWQL